MIKDAIQLLKEDHKKVLSLLTELEASTTRAVKKRSELLEEIEAELLVHTQIEEEIFYPAFKEAGDKDHEKMYYEAVEEHRAVLKLVLPDLKNTSCDSEEFSGRSKVLKELIKHHAEEEETEMFPKAKESLSKQELLDLGARMAERKEELKAEPPSLFQDIMKFASRSQPSLPKH